MYACVCVCVCVRVYVCGCICIHTLLYVCIYIIRRYMTYAKSHTFAFVYLCKRNFIYALYIYIQYTHAFACAGTHICTHANTSAHTFYKHV